MELVCSAFNVHRSCYYEHRKRCGRIDAERVALKAKVNRLFNQSRSSAGSRTMQGLLNEQGEEIGRFKVRSCLLYTSPSPRDLSTSRMPSSA